VPTILEVDPEKHRLEDILRVNFGPNHPSTHGVLRLVVDLDGETVAGIRAVIGYLHTGFEKNMEHKSWWKSVTYAPRMDYVAFHANELLYVLAIEKLLGIEVPPRAVWARMAMAELNRIHSHLVWLGTSALELGAISLFWYCFDDRDAILDLFEMAGGTRMHTRYVQVGGIAEDLPPGFVAEARKFCAQMPKSVDEYEAILDRNAIWLERTKGVGLLSADDALALAQSGPMLRSTGVDWDLRRNTPYLAYDEVEFDVPVYGGGDVYDRYRVHMDEMRESVRIIDQCLDKLETTEGMPWIADDRKVVLPPRHELHTSMESLIHHFKIVTEGFTVPEGEVYVAIESPRGEAGCYLVSDGGARPWRVKFRAPSFAALQATATIVQGLLVADLIAAGGSLDPVMGDADR
jgi:NADH-quinone oxidoreductase subunit D